jgi:hypothetical protein
VANCGRSNLAGEFGALLGSIRTILGFVLPNRPRVSVQVRSGSVASRSREIVGDLLLVTKSTPGQVLEAFHARSHPEAACCRAVVGLM